MPYKQRGADSRISPLVAVGGMLLSGVAGYVNSVSLAFFHIPVSHMSGAATHAGADLAAGDLHAVLFALGIMGSFLLGAGLSGLVIGAARFTPGKRYGLAMLAEGIILTVTAFVIASGRSAGPLLAALACGLQNGMASSYFGLIIRTTHVTGILTDLGVLLGQALRHRTVEVWKLGILSAIFFGFVGGAAIGYAAVERLQSSAFLIAGGGTAAAGLTYIAGVLIAARRKTR